MLQLTLTLLSNESMSDKTKTIQSCIQMTHDSFGIWGLHLTEPYTSVTITQTH